MDLGGCVHDRALVKIYWILCRYSHRTSYQQSLVRALSDAFDWHPNHPIISVSLRLRKLRVNEVIHVQARLRHGRDSHPRSFKPGVRSHHLEGCRAPNHARYATQLCPEISYYLVTVPSRKSCSDSTAAGRRHTSVL